MEDINELQQEYTYGYSAPFAVAYANKYNKDIAVFLNQHAEVFHVAAVIDTGKYMDAFGLNTRDDVAERYNEQDGIKIDVYPYAYFCEKYPYALHGIEQATLDVLYLQEKGVIQ